MGQRVARDRLRVRLYSGESDDDDDDAVVARAIDALLATRRRGATQQYLVRFQGGGEAEWVDELAVASPFVRVFWQQAVATSQRQAKRTRK